MDGERKPIAQGDPATEPIDLAQAFKMYNQANRAATVEPVEEGEPEGDPAGQQPGGDEAPGDGADVVEGGVPAPDDGADVGDGAGFDGSADVIEPIDYNPARENILKGVQQQALRNVREKFQREQIDMWSIQDIYERDEQTGRVRFRNPDDPSRDFQSRYEAQQFVDAMNKQITQRFREEVNKEQRTLIQQEAPKLRLIEFAPKYDAMDKTTKDVFEDMIEPYAVRDSSGDVIGFNVDLDAVARQASRIAQRFQPSQQQGEPQQKEAKASTSPAVDIKTGASQTGSMPEPKTIGEALKMYDASQRKKKGK